MLSASPRFGVTLMSSTASSAPIASMASTSRPAIASRWPSSCEFQGTCTHSPSQERNTFMSSKSLKLAQEAQVVLVEQPQIVHAVAQHREALDTHAKGIAREALRI